MLSGPEFWSRPVRIPFAFQPQIAIERAEVGAPLGHQIGREDPLCRSALPGGELNGQSRRPESRDVGRRNTMLYPRQFPRQIRPSEAASNRRHRARKGFASLFASVFRLNMERNGSHDFSSPAVPLDWSNASSYRREPNEIEPTASARRAHPTHVAAEKLGGFSLLGLTSGGRVARRSLSKGLWISTPKRTHRMIISSVVAGLH